MFIDTAVIPDDETYQIVDANQSPVLVAGNDEHAIFAGSERVILPIPMTLDAELEDITLTQYVPMTPIRMPAGRYGGGGYTYSMEGLPEGVEFDATHARCTAHLTMHNRQHPTTYIVRDRNGITHRVSKNMTVTATTTGYTRVLDSANMPVLVDGAGKIAVF